MTARSTHNGRKIEFIDNVWVYSDTKKPIETDIKFIGKFKVWDSEKNEFTPITNFFIGPDGVLYQAFFNSGGSCDLETADKKYITVWSTGKTDKNSVELFDGDKAIDDHYKEECEIHYNNDLGCWFYGDILLFEELLNIKKTGSKYEEK